MKIKKQFKKVSFLIIFLGFWLILMPSGLKVKPTQSYFKKKEVI